MRRSLSLVCSWRAFLFTFLPWLSAIIVFYVPVQKAQSQSPPFQWARQSGAFGGRGIATDRQGNVFVTGRFSSTANFDSVAITSAGAYDACLAKYDSGGKIQWVQAAGGTGQDDGYAVATDSAGNCYMTGDFSGTATFGNTNLTSAGGYDAFIAKYNSAGVIEWVRQFGGTNNDIGYGLAVDGADNVYLTGYYEAPASLGSTTLTNAGSKDIFLAKFNSNGELRWLQRAGGPGDDRSMAVAVDTAGNAFICGLLGQGGASFGSTNTSYAGGGDFFLAKYSADGAAQWVIWGGGPSTDWAYGVGTDAMGNSYMTGTILNEAMLGSIKLTTNTAGIFTAKFNATGELQWVRPVVMAGGGVFAYAMAVNTNGNSCIAGTLMATTVFGTNILAPTSIQSDGFVACYNSAGTVQWACKMGGSSSDTARAIAVDRFGNFHPTGDFRDLAQFGSFTLPGTSSSGMYLAKIASGQPLLTITPSRSEPHTIMLTLSAPNDRICRIDVTTNWATWSSWATVSNLQSPTNFTDSILPNAQKFYRTLLDP